ncbi:MAG: hypothetical protein AABY09_04865 [Nanoarchaeota archaeon]
MAMRQLQLIVRPTSKMDVNKKLVELRKKDPIFASLVTSILLEDAKRNKGGIFKIKAPQRSRAATPLFRFL